jgi:CMP-N,N'-diacetyllegionaminic acid synthase
VTALAVILARAGSKGVPGKNARTVGGRPCLAWSIEHAVDAQSVSRLVVSTDGDAIAETAREWGAEVVERPAELAADTARVDDAARHAADACGWTGPVVILYACVPVRPAGLIDRAVAMLLERDADSVQSYAPVGKYHPWWMAWVGPDGSTAPVHRSGVYRRQDLPEMYVPDGGVLAVRSLVAASPDPRAFLGERTFGIVNPAGAVVDIDTEADVALAEATLRQEARA